MDWIYFESGAQMMSMCTFQSKTLNMLKQMIYFLTICTYANMRSDKRFDLDIFLLRHMSFSIMQDAPNGAGSFSTFKWSL